MASDDQSSPGWEAARRVVGAGKLSVLMPAHNLGPAIEKNVRTVHRLFSGRLPFEIVVIDDGSTDDTAAQIRNLNREMPEVRPLILDRNMGKGGALRHGFEHCTGDYVVFLDADLDLPADQIGVFFEVMERAKADVVIGSKRHRDSELDYPLQRRIVSAGYYFLVKLLFGLPLHDTQTGLKLFTRRSLEWAFPRLLVKNFAFDLELLALIHSRGFSIAEAPVRVEFQGQWGCVTTSAIRSILNDTLAVFYRKNILRYYQSIPDVKIPAPPPSVSVVIAYPQPSAQLEEVMGGLAQQTYSPFEVILLPDEPSGRTWPAGIREIPTGRVRPAEKRNLGIARAGGAIVAFLDDDAYPAADWLERAVAYFSIPDVLAVGGPSCTPPAEPLMAQLSGAVYSKTLVSGSYRYRYVPERVREVDDYPSCNLFVRAEALRKLGGFPTAYWPGEDTLLCMDLVHKLGGRIMYEPRVVAYHHRRRLFGPHLRQVGRYALHRGLFARRFPRTSRRIGYLMPSLFVLGLAGGAALSAALPALRPAYLGAIALYAAIMLLHCFDPHPLRWLLVWLGAIATHVVYGVRFLQGLLFASPPAGVEKFDHASERGGAAPAGSGTEASP